MADDPRTYFDLPACRICPEAPCGQLRFGGVHAGKLRLVPARTCARSGCPFAAQSWPDIEAILTALPLQDLDAVVGALLDSLAYDERQRCVLDEFVSDYSDCAGRVRYVRRLWEDGVVTALRIPHDYWRDRKLNTYLHGRSEPAKP